MMFFLSPFTATVKGGILSYRIVYISADEESDFSSDDDFDRVDAAAPSNDDDTLAVILFDFTGASEEVGCCTCPGSHVL
jgi:hypothetical protein